VRNHEIIARFYINCIIEGLECEDVDFKLTLNSVKDALITCLQDKYKNDKRKNIKNPNEPEFLSYIIILTLPS